jgi:3-mercaptopyruvate sulfurtransferase SseA
MSFQVIMSGRKFVLLALVLLLSACSTQPTPPPTLAPTPTPTPLPLTERDVPRVTVEEAKAAVDRGAAILVDVRSAEAFEVSHIPGALNIQLGEFETNPMGLDLPKDRWIITYCT